VRLRDSAIEEGIGKVVWHSLTPEGVVDVLDIKFENRLYRNVPLGEVVSEQQQTHEHRARDKDNKDRP
tara:strand:- start:395 stop:598 length:204 start_codon:yes stop_codon:yes gene_type:complete